VNLVAQQVGSSQGSASTVIQNEVNSLITVEGNLVNTMTQLAGQGLASDTVFQQDLSTLVSLEGQLTNLLTEIFGNGQNQGTP
jgi:hypothetical protein